MGVYALPDPLESTAAAAATPVTVEVFVLRAVGDGDHSFCYRHRRAPLSGHEHPDQAARRLTADPPPRPAVRLLHSTSWRFQPTGGVVLTYVAYPDPSPRLAAVLLTDPTIARSADALRPSPPRLLGSHVAAHAVRHLAFLADTDPVVRMVVHADRRLAGALADLPRSPAGQLDSPA